MSLVLEFIKNGLVLGMLYALFSFGLSLVLSVTHVWHFAYGVSVTIAGYTMWLTSTVWGLALPVVIAVGLLVGAVSSAAMEAFVYAPLKRVGASPSIILVGSLALLSIIEGALLLAFGSDDKQVLPAGLLQGRTQLFGVRVTEWDITVVVTCVVVTLLLAALMNRSEVGRRLRALGANEFRAATFGISPTRNYVLVFAMAGAIAVVPAFLLGLRQPLSASSGFDLLAKAFVAIIIGGVGNSLGAFLGGVGVGLTEALASLVLPTQWAVLVLYSLVFIALLARAVVPRLRLKTVTLKEG
jgi:branched-subunit amino acid ABC-type transport system permease component